MEEERGSQDWKSKDRGGLEGRERLKEKLREGGRLRKTKREIVPGNEGVPEIKAR